MEDQDIVREFLLESNENLTRLDQEIVELERRPKDADLLASIFRTIHTIKGTCGFLGFSLLEGVAHQAENILSQLRSGQREVTGDIISLILESIDATKTILGSIEAAGVEGPDRYADLRERLEAAAKKGVEGKDGKAAVNAVSPEVKQNQTMPAPEVSQPVDAVQRVGSEPKPVAPKSVVPKANDVAAKEVPAAAEAEKTSAVSESAIRVDVGLLDKLMNLVGELVLARNQVLQFNSQREDVALNATSQRLNLITTELQEGVMKTRMQPIGLVWNKLPRLVRDVTHSLGKQVRLEMDGADTELDKTIIEAIKDPLTHLIRNSCDHGLERPEDRVAQGKPAQGVITLRAYHEGGQVNIEISDNGCGMDVEKLKQKAIEKGLITSERAARMNDREALNLIFMPGFSTARAVTNVSGRGVGMDVVKSNIEKIGGAVDVATQLGAWTTVKLKIPLTLAIIPGLVVTSGQERFVIPQVSLLELIRLDATSTSKIEQVHGTPVYRRRGSLLPIAYLGQILGLKQIETDVVNIVVLQAEDRQFGLVVDGVNDTQEIVVKPLGKQMKGLTIYAGATIMGDGRVALILDVLGIGRQSGVLASQRENDRGSAHKTTESTGQQQRLLLFRTGSFDRLAVPLSLVSRLEEFPQSVIERTGDNPVVQYRGGILPLLALDSLLVPGSEDKSLDQDPAQVVVFQDGERSVGVAVDRILDIVEDAVTVRLQSARSGFLGSAVVGKHVTDFVDLKTVLTSAFGDWFGPQSGTGAGTAGSSKRRGSILLAEASPFLRGLLRTELEMAGYQVLEAKDAREALSQLDRGPVGMVLAATDLPGGEAGGRPGSRQLLDAVRKRPGAVRIPVLALSSSEASRSADTHAHGGKDFDGYESKFDRQAMLRSIECLAAALAPEAVEEMLGV